MDFLQVISPGKRRGIGFAKRVFLPKPAQKLPVRVRMPKVGSYHEEWE